MTDREADAIRELLNAMRGDMKTVAAILTYMIAQGYTAEEVQAAVNEVAKSHL